MEYFILNLICYLLRGYNILQILKIKYSQLSFLEIMIVKIILFMDLLYFIFSIYSFQVNFWNEIILITLFVYAFNILAAILQILSIYYIKKNNDW